MAIGSYEDEMTTPYERTRAVIATCDFLKKIEQDPTLKSDIREMANQLLRHYPNRSEVLMQVEFDRKNMSPFFSLDGAL
jgi:hypothetical protein